MSFIWSGPHTREDSENGGPRCYTLVENNYKIHRCVIIRDSGLKGGRAGLIVIAYQGDLILIIGRVLE
jgi:hypothetical protein